MGKKVTGVERVAAQSHPSQLSPAAWKINKHTRTNRRTENKKERAGAPVRHGLIYSEDEQQKSYSGITFSLIYLYTGR